MLCIVYYFIQPQLHFYLHNSDSYSWENQNHKFNSSEKKTIADLQNYFNSKSKNTAFNASVLVAAHGKILFSKQYGFLNPVTKIKLNDSCTFQLASTSKPFTATAILILNERGKLNLHDPLEKYFPGINYPGVTIQTLLNHRSGLPNYIYFMDSLQQLFPDSFFSNKDVVDFMIKHHPEKAFNADTKFQYCNTNYVLLAAIVAQVSDETFSDFLNENIFQPAHMYHTYVCNRLAGTKNINETRGYLGSRWNLVAYTPYDGIVGDKGLFSTAYDLFLFHEALMHGILLKPQSLSAAYQGYSFEKSGRKNYGLGWRINQKDHTQRLIYHNGWWKGYNVLFVRNVDQDFVIVILSNHYNRSVYQLNPLLDILNFGNPNDSLDTEE